MSVLLFRLWYSARYLFLIGLITLALLISTSQLFLLPWLKAHPEQVAAWLSQRSGQVIGFEQLDAQWTRQGPRLSLQQVRIGEYLLIDQAHLQLLPYSGWRPGRPFSQVQLRGLTLSVQQDDNGQWIIDELPKITSTDATHNDPLAMLRRLGELQIADARLHIEAPALKLRADLAKINARLRVNGQRLQAGIQLWMDPQTQPLTAVLALQPSTGDSLAFVRLEPVNWAAWSPLLSLVDIDLQQGQGPLQAWMHLQQYQLTSAIALAQLSNVQLQGAAFAAQAVRPKVHFEQVQLRARWQRHEHHWTLTAPQLRIALAGDPLRVLDGLHVSGGQAYVLRGRQIDATPLLRLATLSPYVDVGLRQWLYQAQPQLRFNDVDIVAQADQYTWIRGELAEAAFVPTGAAPGLSGLRGVFEGDQHGLALHLQASDTVRFDWPSGFGVVHEVQLEGVVAIWRQGKGTHISTPILRITGSDYAADVRGGLHFQGDGTRPWIGMAASLDDSPMTAAKRFWVRSQMSQAAIDWLDAALVEGHVHGGLGLAVGDLDDWPFENNNGRFEARGQIIDGQIHFTDGWPLLRQVQADIGFIGNGFTINGAGMLADAPIAEFTGAIDDFSQPWLTVTARSDSDSADLLNLLRESTLQIEHAQTLAAVSVNGPASVTFDLLQALDDDLEGQGHLRGEIDLQSVSLADSRVEELPLEQVNGKVIYSDNGFSAPALRVRHPGGAGVLALRSGEFVRQASNAFEAILSVNAKASDLLDKVTDLHWLKPWINGSSRWHIAFNQRQTTDENTLPSPLLHLYSDLRGTGFQLPAPLNKPAHQPLPVSISTTLLSDNTDIEVTLGQKFALTARVHNEGTGIYVRLGSSRTLHSAPANGLIIEGHTNQLDAAGWLALSGYRQGESSANGLTLQRADIRAGELQLAGGYFPNTHVQLQPRTHALNMHFSGPTLAGQLYIPDTGPISGQFSRVYWRSASTNNDAELSQANTFAEPLNPRDLPALALVADEVRFDDISLGQAVLHTQPLPDGIRINTFQLHAPKQRFDLHGHWRGLGVKARTQLSATLYSENVGQWLDQLDYGGQLDGGQGQMQLTIGWSGAPDAFALARLQGSLHIDIRNGQLLEVQPGAGRMLGLLSLSQLPRRLRLDFRDFFARGLAFNQLKGTIDFDEGIARTSAIDMHGPAVDIRLYGQANLQQRTFDQIIEVNPRSGNLLAAVGAMTGGPVGAAVGAATNAVLSKPLGNINAKTWHITGPWHDPHVKEIKRSAD